MPMDRRIAESERRCMGVQVPESMKECALEVLLSRLRDALDAHPDERTPFRILEIGTAHGFSAISMAGVSPRIVVHSMEKNETRAAEARIHIEECGLSDRIRVDCVDAGEALSLLSDGTFDFALMDGPKAQYMQHFLQVYRLLKAGGTICMDNVNFRRDEKRYKTIMKRMEAFRNYLAEIGAFIDRESGVAVYYKEKQ